MGSVVLLHLGSHGCRKSGMDMEAKPGGVVNYRARLAMSLSTMPVKLAEREKGAQRDWVSGVVSTLF